MVFDNAMVTLQNAAQKLPISLVVITLNEESHLADCLRSAYFVSEIVVVDTQSTDKTVEIARGLGAKVFSEPWKGFGPQKKDAVSKAQYDWVLCLDADERVSPELAREIFEVFETLDPQIGYRIPRLSYHMKRWIRHGGWYPDAQLRLFNRTHAQWSDDIIHEKVLALKSKTLKNNLQHFVFKSISHQIQTNNRYSSLQAEQSFKQGQRFSMLRFLFKPLSKFIECYFWKLGFLDGMPGFFIAIGASYSVFIRHAKIWELEKQ
jgi:glycosyltransferase involved in cell wall biosynthesis